MKLLFCTFSTLLRSFCCKNLDHSETVSMIENSLAEVFEFSSSERSQRGIVNCLFDWVFSADCSRSGEVLVVCKLVDDWLLKKGWICFLPPKKNCWSESVFISVDSSGEDIQYEEWIQWSCEQNCGPFFESWFSRDWLHSEVSFLEFFEISVFLPKALENVDDLFVHFFIYTEQDCLKFQTIQWKS